MRDRKAERATRGGGVNGSRLKFLAIGKIDLVPKYTPNPRVPGTVWSSYGGAIPTQESPRNKQDPTRRERPRESLPTRLKRHGYSSDIFVPSSSPWKPQHPTSSTGLFPPQSLLFLGGSLTAASFFAVELWVYLLFSLDYNIITQQAQVWPCSVHEIF